jgi:hypothetical protein
MAYVGPSNYVVVVVHVGGSKASNIKLVLQRESRTVKLCFLPVRFYLTKSMRTLRFMSCLKKLALL